MKSKVTLYYKSLVNKEKNFVLDNQDGTSALETYLSTLTSEFINEYQYVKQGLSVSIKLNKNQTALEMVDSKDLNYIKIQNYNDEVEPEVLEKPYYYFVIAKNWRAKDTIELVLSMDTLNTFRFNYDYRLNKKSITKRMHKDRFEQYTNSFKIAFVTGVVHAEVEVGQVYSGSLRDFETKEIFLGNITFQYTGSIVIIQCKDPVNNKEEIKSFLERIGSSLIDIHNDENISVISAHTIHDIETQTFRKIDFKSEDISAPVYKKSEDIIKEQEGDFDNSWILYYKNKDNQDNSPIDCFLTSNLEFDFLTETGDNEITIADVPSGKTLFVCDLYQGEVIFDVDGEPLSIHEATNTIWFPQYISYTDYVCLGFENRNGVLVVHQYIFRSGISYDMRYHREIINPNRIIINSSLAELKVREVDEVLESYAAISPDNPFSPNQYNDTLTLQPLVTRHLVPSSTIDKTLSENLKIINVPYCPTQLKKENDKYIIGGEWSYDTTLEFFKLKDFSAKFENDITSNVDDIINIFTSGIVLPNLNLKRTIIDSKLYHSDYYRPKFVYDSFSRIFPLEQIDYRYSYLENSSGKLKFTFVMSRNIVSKFLFKFDYVYKYSNEDYPNVVAVARNNEEVLYNSAYLNYVRTGYNYDLKAKERSETASGVGIGLNIAGLIASIGLSFIPGGQVLGVGGAIGAGLGLAGQIVNYAKTISQNEENLQRKLQETQRQAVSVLNADDYDLLQAYTDNKAKLCLYEVSEQMKRVLDDLFYYCGYIVNEQMIPNISSRYWFNFVQAGLIIEDSSNLNSDIEDDIKEKFEQGVTFLHYHNKFDFVQEMENWETSLLD